jgi:putative serine protease PepD
MNEFGVRDLRGYAFVISTTAGTSDLLTDYHLIVDNYMQGKDTVDLQHGERTFTAKVIAVSPDPHVALLRIDGAWHPLAISPTSPRAGDTVTVGPFPPDASRQAAVIAYTGPGGATHLTFSVEVPSLGDGTPVLDSSGRVVGIAEPTSQFRAGGVGFAVPIPSACAAVAAC